MTKLSVICIIITILLFGGLAFLCAVLRNRVRLLQEKLADSFHKRAETTRFMSIFARNIRSASEIEDWMNVSARYVADLVEAQSVCVFLRSGDTLHTAGVFGPFPPLSSQKAGEYVLTKPKYLLEVLKRDVFRMGVGFIGEVAQNREELCLADPQLDPRIAGLDTMVPIRTLMTVPLENEGSLIGILCAVNSKNSGKPFSADQFGRFKFIASQVVLAQNIIQVYAELSEQQRISQELTFARNLQLSMIPKQFPVWGKFVIHGFTRASKEVSGDFYDFVQIDDNRLLVVIGDACGKGIPACMIMAMTRTFIRSSIDYFSSLKDLLRSLNENLYRDTVDERYITLGCCLIDKKESTIEYARAGHTPLLLYLRNHVRLVNPDGSALGLLPSELSDFDTLCTEITPGTMMLMFTDGINETTNGKDEFYGIPRLVDVYKQCCLDGNTPDEVLQKILQSTDEYSVNVREQEDDQTMVIINHI